MAGGFADSTRMERDEGTAILSGWRDIGRIVHFWRAVRAFGSGGGGVDCVCADWTVNCSAGRMVDSVVDCAAGKRGYGWGHNEFEQSTFWDCCADRDGIHRFSDEEFSVGVFGGGGVFDDWDCELRFAAGRDYADSGAGVVCSFLRCWS